MKPLRRFLGACMIRLSIYHDLKGADLGHEAEDLYQRGYPEHVEMLLADKRERHRKADVWRNRGARLLERS